MYTTINKNIDKLLKLIDPVKDIGNYIWLLENIRNTDVTVDKGFQTIYQDYWGLTNAGLSSAFIAAYFKHLQFLKMNPRIIDVKTVATTLYGIPTHIDGSKSLQFSFASKMVHMLCPNLPIYDHMLEMFFFLPEKRSGKDFESKLANLHSSYLFMVDEYRRIIEKGLLRTAIESFRSYFKSKDSCSTISDEKIIDTLLWNFVVHHTRGSIRERFLMYS